jgi:AbrB family looped-hinge helix DNA binding protein
MSQAVSVKVSSRYQVSVPRTAREQLNIESGDRLLVDVQDGVLILIPQPQDYAKHMAGLHKEIWEDVDTDTYLEEERQAWKSSESN